MSDLRSRLDALDKAARWDVDISRPAFAEWRPMRKARDILKSRQVPMLGRALLKREECSKHCIDCDECHLEAGLMAGCEEYDRLDAEFEQAWPQALAELAKALERS